jgi:hypothetical protein
MSIREIIRFIDNYLDQSGQSSINPVEANALLEKAGLLRDSDLRPGKPLRDLLRKGLIPHAFQSGGKSSGWSIPHSSQGASSASNYPAVKIKYKGTARDVPKTDLITARINVSALTQKLESARQKYKPILVKYLLIAEAPPDSIERFFYYENVKQHDHLFLGVAQALYPELKEKFLSSGRDQQIKAYILRKLQQDGFFLLDLSELPLSYMTGTLDSNAPSLIPKVRKSVISETRIILIKATVYDTAFQLLRNEFGPKVIDCRIPYPGQGGQKLIQEKFKQALEMAGF